MGESSGKAKAEGELFSHKKKTFCEDSSLWFLTINIAATRGVICASRFSFQHRALRGAAHRRLGHTVPKASQRMAHLERAAH